LSNQINSSSIVYDGIGAKSLAKKAHEKRSKAPNPAVDIKADSKTSSTDSPSGSKNASYDSDHKGSSSASPSSIATDDKYSHK
jgi:hypothetical protein